MKPLNCNAVRLQNLLGRNPPEPTSKLSIWLGLLYQDLS